ncbi:hypothetical protein ACFWN7_08075 [Agromyces sp. NPDC058484]|uniref:hypothetical protein n=1 Tax=Agromyces sp. NPDC058484 TaxID=3346524 RepID=UPI0036575DD7
MPSSRPRPPRLRASASIAAAGVLAFALSGCVTAPTPTATPSPSSPAEPIFASDKEALAAALEAFDAYSQASAQVSAGAAAPATVYRTVTPAFAETLNAEFSSLRDSGLSMLGDIRIDNAKLAESTFDENGAIVSIYFCRDVSAVRVIGADGSDVTPADRDDRVPTHAFFVSSPDNPSVVLVDGVELWTGDDFC